MAAAFSLHPTRAGDLFWQIRVGHDILLTGHPPHFDMYSWTRHGQPWVVNEWLSFVILFEVFQAAQGFAGPLLFEEAMIVLIVLALYVFLSRATKSSAGACIIAFLTLSACAVYLQPRPFLFTYLFLIVSLGFCAEVRQLRLSPRALWLLPPLFCLWANLHQGVVVGVGFLGVLSLAEFSQYFWFLAKKDETLAQPSKLNGIRFGLLFSRVLLRVS